MTEHSWTDPAVEQTVQDKGIFVNVDGLKQKDLVKQFDAPSWPKIVVAEPYRDSSGKLQARVVDSMTPENEEQMSAASLNKFLLETLEKKAAASGTR